MICPVAGSPRWLRFLAVLAILLAMATLEKQLKVLTGAERSILGCYRRTTVITFIGAAIFFRTIPTCNALSCVTIIMFAC